MTQNIRPSQFILVYGPGTILEGKDGPRLIPSVDIGLFSKGSEFDIKRYCINDERMSKGLLNGANIFRLPTNDELGWQEKPIFRTREFPTWNLCLNQNKHGSHSLLYRARVCPICKESKKGNPDAIGFVMACRSGHMDDVRWSSLVHWGSSCPENKAKDIPVSLRVSNSFWWERSGGTLSDVDIKCPRCDMHRNLGNMYYKELQCTGRYPERESLDGRSASQPGCSTPARIMTRQASNLRLTENKTLLSIQSVYTNLDNLLEDTRIKDRIDSYHEYIGTEITSKEIFMDKILGRLFEKGKITKKTYEAFDKAGWKDIQEALQNSDKPVSTTYHGLIMSEFDELVKASIYGAPPHIPENPGQTKVIFEADPNSRTVATTRNKKFLITPIQTLRTVTVQKGYTREIPDDSEDPDKPPPIIPVDITDAGNKWYPGIEFLGEGLFIRLDPDQDPDQGWSPKTSGNSHTRWVEALHKSHLYDKMVFRDGDNSKDELDPGFVWWHTLSHMLIRAIGDESGYSSASIRERVYFERKDDRSRGGILLYATQPGNEGTLGGMVALAPNMQTIFERVVESAGRCSGDPLCMEQKLETKGYNGAACYGCLMNSETSCDHRNMWLDRHVLAEDEL